MDIFRTSLICLIILVTFGAAKAQTEFSKLSVSTDSTYGRRPTNPIKLRKGEMGRSIAYSVAYLSGLRTPDNQTLQRIARITVTDPAYHKPAIGLTVRATGLPASGKLGLLDKYVFLTSVKRDTLILYVDIYNRGNLALPVGFKYMQGLD